MRAGPNMNAYANGGFSSNISVADLAAPDMVHLIDTQWYVKRRFLSSVFTTKIFSLTIARPNVDNFRVSPNRYQWPPLNPLWHQILMVFMFMIGTLSFFGNGLVIYVFTTTKTLRTPSNLFVVNLAFSDFCMMFCMCPAMIYNCYNETWTLGIVILLPIAIVLI